MPAPLLPTFPGLVFPVTRSNLGFDVDRLESVSGGRTTWPNRAVPRYRWSVGFEMLRTSPWGGTTLAELETLAGFYNRQRGTAYPFAYRDARDNAATAQPFGTGDAATRKFHLVRAFGGFTEPVLAPLTWQVFADGALVGPDAYSVGAYGRVTFTTPPARGAALTWTGTFAWLCRFDDDAVEFVNFMSGLWSVDKLTFSSEILP